MKRITLADWKQLMDLQKEGGLSIAAFCKQKNTPTSNFYKYRNKLNPNKSSDVFIKAKQISPQHLLSPQLVLTYGESKLTVSNDCSPSWLADLIKALHP